MTDDNQKKILRSIARERENLFRLDTEKEHALQRIVDLEAELAACGESELETMQGGDEIKAPETTAEKVALFSELFRGRADVFPRRWENKKKGTSGYSPACQNEWVRELCEKPRLKCGGCSNQAFLPVTDQVVLDHLRGCHVAGVYPLLKDETCWFLAIDFDGKSWKDDVTALITTSRVYSVPVAVERSRSGNGAHVWIFFQEPVKARVARRMGTFLITETMSRRYELPLSSYDRFFPNQDTMPRGGFGNLIALPFQNEARQRGNSVFVDEAWRPYESQWHHLSTLRRMAPREVDSIARAAVDRDGVPVTHGLGLDDVCEDRSSRVKVLSALEPGFEITGPLPGKVKVIRAQQLLIEKSGLPPSLLNQIKHLAAFQNPEFYRKQAMRFSTALTPRIINCAEDRPEHMVLPRGCFEDLEELLASHGIEMEVEGTCTDGTPIEVYFHGKLTQVQKKAVGSLLSHDYGLFVAPPGSGKTVVGAWLIASRRRNTLVLVHRIQLMDQWVAQLAAFLNVDAKDIGRMGSGKNKPYGRLDVAMIQSLARRDNIDEIIRNYGHVIVDECHHVPAVSFERVMRAVNARYITGLTATPRRRDGHDPILKHQVGPVRFSIDSRTQAAQLAFSYRLILRETEFVLDKDSEKAGIQEIYRQIAQDEKRNAMIIDDVINALEEGRSPILLTERRDHLELLAGCFQGFARNIVVLRGGMGIRQRCAAVEMLKNLRDDEERLILATGRFVGEGFDDARLDTLFLAMPVSWRGTLVQYTGRLHRQHKTKTEVRVVDYVDRAVPMLERMFEKRMRGYRAMGYSVGR